MIDLPEEAEVKRRKSREQLVQRPGGRTKEERPEFQAGSCKALETTERPFPVILWPMGCH